MERIWRAGAGRLLALSFVLDLQELAYPKTAGTSLTWPGCWPGSLYAAFSRGGSGGGAHLRGPFCWRGTAASLRSPR
jgi:hypothetical protein